MFSKTKNDSSSSFRRQIMTDDCAGRSRKRFLLGFLITSLLLAAGCGSESASDMIRRANKTNSKKLANLYMMYQANHSWSGPKDEAAFKEYIKSADKSILEEMGVDPAQVDELFVSERDNEPFKIRYGISGGMGKSDPVIFETTGKSGSWIVGFTAMREEEVTSQDVYNEMWEGRFKEESTGRDSNPMGDPGQRRR